MTNEERVLEVQNNINVKENMERLFIDNKRFIVMMIKKSANSSDIPKDVLEEYIQGSYFAIVETIEKFDAKRGFKFITLLGWYIRKQLLRYDLPNSGLYKHEISLNEPLKDDGEATRLDMLEDKDAIPIEEQVITKDELEFKRKVWGAVERALPDKEMCESIIQKYRYKKSNKQIAEERGVENKIVTNQIRKAKDLLFYHKEMKRYKDEYWCSLGYGIGLSRFKTTFTSSTEAAAFNKMGLDLKDSNIWLSE